MKQTWTKSHNWENLSFLLFLSEMTIIIRKTDTVDEMNNKNCNYFCYHAY